MTLSVETFDKKQQILIIDKNATAIGELLQTELGKYDIEVSYSSRFIKTDHEWDCVFLINEDAAEDLYNIKSWKQIVFIFINAKNKAQKLASEILKKGISNSKVVNLASEIHKTQALERILWFAFSKSKEIFLNLEGLPESVKSKRKKIKLSQRKILAGLIIFLLALLLSVFPIMIASSYFFYRSLDHLRHERIDRTQRDLRIGTTLHKTTAALYKISRPIYLFLSFGLLSDNLISINEKAKQVITESLVLYEDSSTIAKLILKKDKSAYEKTQLLETIQRLKRNSISLENNLVSINQKIPDSLPQIKKIKEDLAQTLEFIKKGKDLLPQLENLLAKDTTKKYLLLFVNNMELRPGGGFIGSYGILTLTDLTVENIEVYDVYDADGQLKDHIEPPSAIRKYLNQPNWFLRDSAWSPDSFENYVKAKFFLQEELGLSDFSGGILITTSAIQDVLGAYGNLYIPSFNDYVNRNNFYLKAQSYSEREFFPGSIQKKSFLSSVANQLLINLDNASSVKLAAAIKTSLDEKQIALSFEDDKIQSVVDSLYWSGKIILPHCSSTLPCISDYLLQADANLGVNKANYYINRNLTHQIKINRDGIIQNTFLVNYRNESPSTAFPGGVYKNYFQILLPAESNLKSFTKNGVLIENFDERQDAFKTAGFLMEIQPQATYEIQVKYQLKRKLKKGKNIYELVIQKQIGAKNSDLNLEIILPPNIRLSNQNFSPLVKSGRIFYNTSLSADKIFIFELIRE